MTSSDNDSGHEFERDLQELIRNRQVVAVIGSGVSRATNTQSPSWPGLIELAVERCGRLDNADAWCQMVRNMLGLQDPSMLLAAAELVEQRLREHNELGRWLSDTFRPLQPEDPTVIRLLERLVSWDVPLVTTNYDGLIEAVTNLGHVCWTDSADAQSVVRGGDRRVLHLHGHWERPDSVVLGIRSYEAIRNSQHPQDVLKALGMTKSFLFVGCGGPGLSDPNLGRFLEWLAAQDASAGVRHRHYSLVRRCEAFPPRGRLFPLVFGNDFDDLPKFLDRVLPVRETTGPAGGQTAGTTRLPPALPASVTCYLNRLADENERADQVPELAEISRRYAESADRQTRGFAAEILARRSVALESAMRDKDVYVDPRTGIALVTIPAGRFLMGSDRGDSDERPVHEVRIPRDFLLGKYPVTNAQYARFLEAVGGSVSKPRYWDDRRLNQPEQPVVGVTWDEARSLCEWAGGRLPSEAEWEYACRAGTTTAYSFDDDPAPLGEYVWFKGNSDGQTQPVGTKLPNPWGLFDMHGNVWEWCEDSWHDRYQDAPDDGSVWVDRVAAGSFRVIRGGCWANHARICRCACRYGWHPGSRYRSRGFRFVLAATFNE